jgi:membrane-associated phospholipid phosphatase
MTNQHDFHARVQTKLVPFQNFRDGMLFNLLRTKHSCMLKKLLITFIISCFFRAAYSQVDTVPADTIKDAPITEIAKAPVKMYNFKPAVDIPLVLVTGGWSGFAFTKIYSKPKSTEQEILDLDKKDIPGIDRWAAGLSDDNADATSNYLFYGSIPVPFALFLDKKIRKDAAKISYLYLEAMSITGLFYTGSVYLVDRYRPETYNESIPATERLSGNYKDAFLAGHPALVATSLFFTAKVYADYNPESGFKYALYGFAIAGTGATTYLRHIAGKHFPTDLLAGVTLGTVCGILVPQLHKYKKNKAQSLGLFPYFNGNARGLGLTYTFK